MPQHHDKLSEPRSYEPVKPYHGSDTTRAHEHQAATQFVLCGLFPRWVVTRVLREALRRRDAWWPFPKRLSRRQHSPRRKGRQLWE